MLLPLCRVFTIMYPKQTMFLGYVVLYLQFVLHVISPVKCVLYSYITTFRSMCAVPNMAVFIVPLLLLLLLLL